MNKRNLYFGLATTIIFIVSLSLHSCIIRNPQPEDCSIVTARIIEITKGPSFDIVFHDNSADRYYINRGLENRLNLDSLNAKVLNKTVTLHLPDLFYGTSEHIAQLAIDDEIIFTEFSSNADATED
ncbi:MAG: hypothetical protein ACJAZK_001475 [Psychroserpens sp.]|jgi:hypothetical protein|uniref:hypothetical protein n=1 Tax=Psychroserpens sp. TaxID=2020870 RepID=UPI0039E3F5A8